MTDTKHNFDTSAKGLFPLLKGRWTQRRTIKPGGHYTGFAQFEMVDDTTLTYHEEGTLTTDTGYCNIVHRDYVFKREGDGIAVYFAETPLRLFHHLTFDSQAMAKAEHACDPDHYTSLYHFTDATHLTITHQVRGPRKDYTMVTHYAR